MRTWLLLALSLTCLTIACDRSESGEAAAQTEPGTQASESNSSARTGQPEAGEVAEGMQAAVFAGGCFWCMEGPFEALDGVSEVISGYTGGDETNPTYRQVSSGRTGHTEAVRVIYDPEKVTYDELLHVFWRSMDPTDSGGQFADRGSQYRPGIYYLNEEQRVAAEQSKRQLEESGPFDEPIVVPIEPAQTFYVAEDYHQDYYKKNEGHYQRYKRLSGRSGFLEETWGDEHH
jgi:methionine-S-sulfoxide reductase